MKKLILLLLGIIVIGIAAIYFFIPPAIVVSKSVKINANHEGVFRYLRTDPSWQKWWPGKIVKGKDGKTILTLNDYRFSLEKVLYNAFEFNIERNKDAIGGSLYLIPMQVDSFKIILTSNVNSGIDPVTKIKRYFFAREFENTVGKILLMMSDHFNKTENIYGVDIKKEQVQFQYLVSTKNSFNHVPATKEVYMMISELKRYISESHAKEVGPPMLNISTKDSAHFDTQVAIPVDTIVTGNKFFVSKWMLKGGNILVSEVQGDMNAINQGFENMEKYISDYHRATIAIPFQLLLTDRSQQADSTKWVTRLYYPVM